MSVFLSFFLKSVSVFLKKKKRRTTLTQLIVWNPTVFARKRICQTISKTLFNRARLTISKPRSLHNLYMSNQNEIILNTQTLTNSPICQNLYKMKRDKTKFWESREFDYGMEVIKEPNHGVVGGLVVDESSSLVVIYFLLEWTMRMLEINHLWSIGRK